MWQAYSTLQNQVRKTKFGSRSQCVYNQFKLFFVFSNSQSPGRSRSLRNRCACCSWGSPACPREPFRPRSCRRGRACDRCAGRWRWTQWSWLFLQNKNLKILKLFNYLIIWGAKNRRKCLVNTVCNNALSVTHPFTK